MNLINSKYAKLNDRSLVTIIQQSNNRYEINKASEALFIRYERQIHKNWLRLEAQLDHSGIVQAMKEDYYDEAYEAFIIAIQKVDLDRIENDNWKLVGMLNWYLANVRTKLIKIALKNSKVKALDAMHRANNGDDCMTADPDVEEAYWNSEGYKNEPSYSYEVKESEKRCSSAIMACKEKWNNLQNSIFELLNEGYTRAEISRKLNCESAKIYILVNGMKEDIKRYL